MNSPQMIQTVALKSVKCYAYHGFYPEENIIGQYFLVDISLRFKAHENSYELSNSVNYEWLNNLILLEMKNTQKLLETVVQNMVKAIQVQFPDLLTIHVGIHKLNPPMEGQVGESFVGLELDLLKS